MCTLIIVHEVHNKYPLIVAANRDEHADRPTIGPALIQDVPFSVVAPRDLVNHGTWIGAGSGGWFVGLTNQDTGERLIMDKKSRGAVVHDLLMLGNHCLATRYLVALNPNDFNPFNVVFGRPGAMFLCRIHPDVPMDLTIIDKGVTVVTNDCIALKYRTKECKAELGAAKINVDDAQDVIISKLKKTLSSHAGDSDPYQSLCVHDSRNSWKTRSSTIAMATNDGCVDYFHSEGNPCESAGFALTHQLLSIDFSDLENR